MHPLVPYLWAAGGVQLLMAAANAVLPGKLHYRENLAKVAPIIRQIFIVHSVYIVLVLVMFSGLCFLFAPELAGRAPLGRFLSGGMALFWLPRLFIQVFYYDDALKRQNRVAHLTFTLAVAALVVIFGLAVSGVVR